MFRGSTFSCSGRVYRCVENGNRRMEVMMRTYAVEWWMETAGSMEAVKWTVNIGCWVDGVSGKDRGNELDGDRKMD